jgi:hypothetical protein
MRCTESSDSVHGLFKNGQIAKQRAHNPGLRRVAALPPVSS